MSELNFKGKEFVYNHHLTVPHRPLVPDAQKSVGEPRLDGNLVVHGDNLEALKALLPLYAGRIDCVFIDPPYNTGNESWSYNDNVNSPMIQEWLKSNPIGIEDGLRHDKWCAMMWPRLRLLHELLTDQGSFWMTIDDNEVHRARGMLDEIFGEGNFLANFVWQSKDTPGNNSEGIAETHNHVLLYRKSDQFTSALLDRNEEQIANYTNPDNDPRGPWLAAPLTRAEHRDRDVYPLENKVGVKVPPPKGSSWRRPPKKMKWLQDDNRIWWGKNGDATFPMEKKFLTEAKAGVVNQTWWPYEFAGSTRNAGAELKAIFNGQKPFDTPKPLLLLQRVLELATDESSIVLDSFAGSGTTGHAVLAANKADGGDRRFILVEAENYADVLTAERLRRVTQGYEFEGNQRTELLTKKIGLAELKNSAKIFEEIASYENLRGHEFDKVEKKIKDGVLTVEGVKAVTERSEGLGGSFTFCTLGKAIELDQLLTGHELPSFEQLGALLFHMATNEAVDQAAMFVKDGHGYLGESAIFHIWLIYKPELDFLKSREAALTLAKARDLAAAKPNKRHLVFAPAKFVSQKLLDEAKVPVEFAPLPWALYRVDRG